MAGKYFSVRRFYIFFQGQWCLFSGRYYKEQLCVVMVFKMKYSISISRQCYNKYTPKQHSWFRCLNGSMVFLIHAIAFFWWEAKENAIDFAFIKNIQFSFRSHATILYTATWAYEAIFIHAVHICRMSEFYVFLNVS